MFTISPVDECRFCLFRYTFSWRLPKTVNLLIVINSRDRVSAESFLHLFPRMDSMKKRDLNATYTAVKETTLLKFTLK